MPHHESPDICNQDFAINPNFKCDECSYSVTSLTAFKRSYFLLLYLKPSRMLRRQALIMEVDEEKVWQCSVYNEREILLLNYVSTYHNNCLVSNKHTGPSLVSQFSWISAAVSWSRLLFVCSTQTSNYPSFVCSSLPTYKALPFSELSPAPEFGTND